MSYHRHYKPRDFDFAHRLLTLRRRTRLTQEEVAFQVGVTEKAIRNWEGGSHYPTEANLLKLIELYLDHDAFAPGQEPEEARQIWDQLRASTRRRSNSGDELGFAALLKQWRVRHTSQASPQEKAPHSVLAAGGPVPSRPVQGDWGAALDVSSVYGRAKELAEVEQWLLIDRCRLIAVLGMGGIGKTTLAVKLAQQVAHHFDCVLWRSLHNAPALDDTVLDWLEALSASHNVDLPQSIDQRIALLLELLQERRCLLVLDNLETLFQEGLLEGSYREGYEGYAVLIRRLTETTHQGCLLLTCREFFSDLGASSGQQAPVRVLRLSGLDLPASQQLLHDKDLFGPDAAWGELVERYTGNPLALKIVAETIRELFGGDIAAFLAEGFLTFYGIRQLLDRQFERLSPLEQAVMYWLAIERELIGLDAIWQDLRQSVSKGEVVEALHSLRYRSLVERGERGAIFILQPAVLEYVTERLVSLVSQEIDTGEPELLLKYALLQGQARDYVRASQEQLLLQPVLDRLVFRLGSARHLEERLERTLEDLRALPRAEQGYGGGNIVNLLLHLNGQIRGKDCSGLTIWQANLQAAETQDASFAGSDLTGSVVMETINSIASVALSPDGGYLAAGVNNGEIHLWRVADGQPLLAFLGHSRLAWTLAFHPQGSLLASGGYDGLVKIWDIKSGQCLHTLQGHTRWVKKVAFDPKGQLLASCGDDRSIRLWDLATGRCLKVWPEQSSAVWSLAFSPDGKLLASGQINGEIKVWERENGQCLWSAPAHGGTPIPALAFSPDGHLLVSAGNDSRLQGWAVSSGAPLTTLSGHTDVAQSLAFAGERLLVSSSHDRSLKLWQLTPPGTAGQCLSTLHGHSGWVWSVTTGPGGLLASGSQDGSVKLWQISPEKEGGKCVRTLRGYSRMINAIAFDPEGKLLVSLEHNGSVRMWETTSGQCLQVLHKQVGAAFALAFQPGGRLFAHSSPDKTIKVWEVESGLCLRTLRGHQGEIWSLTSSPDGRFLLSGSLDRTIKLWEAESGRCHMTLPGHHTWVWSLTWSSDGRLLASGDSDGVVKLWEAESGRCLRTLHGSPKPVVALTFTADGTSLLSSNEQDLVSTWDVQSGQLLQTLPGIGDTYWLRLVAFSPDGSLLAAASHDRTVKLWDVSRGELLDSLPCPVGRPWSLALSADHRLLAAGTDDGSILLWERQSGNSPLILRGDRPYERLNIAGVTGITEAQRASLLYFGAVEGGK